MEKMVETKLSDASSLKTELKDRKKTFLWLILGILLGVLTLGIIAGGIWIFNLTGKRSTEKGKEATNQEEGQKEEDVEEGESSLEEGKKEESESGTLEEKEKSLLRSICEKALADYPDWIKNSSIIKNVWEIESYLGGRGGYYLDDVNIAVSPKNNYIYLIGT